MTKTFTCKELGGVCDETFAGDSLPEIMQKGAPHMMSDDAHKASIMGMQERTDETKEQWAQRMQQAFDAKPQD